MGVYPPPSRQVLNVGEVTSNDMPILFKYTNPDISKDDYEIYNTEFSMISGGQCSDGIITFYATDIPKNDIKVCLLLGYGYGDGRLLLGGSSGSSSGSSEGDKEISNVVITVTDKAGVVEGATIIATCNTKSWSTVMRNGVARIYASEVGIYTLSATPLDDPSTEYSTKLICTYFGRFSTDIYSGSLVITCTEEGGSGKECLVCSCDDEYKITNKYYLSQYFDDTMELSFLGISAGKYIIIIDGKYKFFKEIQSIEKTNTLEVDLKQWLYKKGNECPWNTGGWVIGQVSKSANNFKHPNISATNATAAANVVFNPDHILFTCSCSSSSFSYRWSGHDYWVRAAASCVASFGTRKPIYPLGATLHIDGNVSLIASFRSGAANDASTNINTPTILQKAAANGLKITFDSESYLVFGGLASISQVGSSSSAEYDNPGGASYNCSGNITEIYLTL